MKYKITNTFKWEIELADDEKPEDDLDLETLIYDKLESEILRNNSTPEVEFWMNIKHEEKKWRNLKVSRFMK